MKHLKRFNEKVIQPYDFTISLEKLRGNSNITLEDLSDVFNHMDVEWVLVHLCNDSSQQPLGMECMVGGKNTKHTIIVAPKLDGAMVSDL